MTERADPGLRERLEQEAKYYDDTARNGELKIGEVVYVRERKHYPYGAELVTTVGVVDPGEIFELRRRP